MANKQKSIAESVSEIAEPIVKSLELELWDVEFLKEGASWFLRVYIDKEDGKISIEDCEKVSRALDKNLDEKNLIGQGYYLEVSSPGIERELKRESHFKKFMGSDIHIKLFKAENGVRELDAKLCGYKDGELIIELQNKEEIKININNCAKIKLKTDFFI